MQFVRAQTGTRVNKGGEAEEEGKDCAERRGRGNHCEKVSLGKGGGVLSKLK